MDRRDLFRILAAGAFAQHAFGYQPRFFTQPEYDLVDALAEVIIPADDQSPGAHAAGVAFYIDTVLHYADPPTQATWRTGMKAVAAENSTPAEVVVLMARNEANPTTDLEHFFPRLKRMAIEGYALSDVGMHQHFGYKGDTAIHHFTGCTHPEHQRP